MNARATPQRAGRDARLRRRERAAYGWGLAVAAVLTAAPFAAVRWHVLSPRPLFVLIGVLALVQMIVHFRCFLHVGLGQRREDLQLVLFSALVLAILLVGTLWIMANLAGRMALPGAP
jgi:cytochrome o ubiquinol oxidase operon protein cyoD